MQHGAFKIARQQKVATATQDEQRFTSLLKALTLQQMNELALGGELHKAFTGGINAKRVMLQQLVVAYIFHTL